MIKILDYSVHAFDNVVVGLRLRRCEADSAEVCDSPEPNAVPRSEVEHFWVGIVLKDRGPSEIDPVDFDAVVHEGVVGLSPSPIDDCDWQFHARVV